MLISMPEESVSPRSQSAFRTPPLPQGIMHAGFRGPAISSAPLRRRAAAASSSSSGGQNPSGRIRARKKEGKCVSISPLKRFSTSAASASAAQPVIRIDSFIYLTMGRTIVRIIVTARITAITATTMRCVFLFIIRQFPPLFIPQIPADTCP